MKLCRFELKSAPGDVKSGIVYSGKVYETDGSEAIAVHEADQVRPLAPVGQPPSIRIFRSMPGLIDSDETPAYFYGSPSAMVGASSIVTRPEFVSELDYEPYIVAVIGGEGGNVPIDDADDMILGYSIMNVLVARDIERYERRVGSGPGRSYDIALVVGPVITTPDEMEDLVQNAELGRRFKLTAVSRVNGVEKRRGDVVDMPFTFAQAISTASETAPLRTGDIIALGPIALAEAIEPLTPGDEVQIAVELLGTLSLKIAP